MKVKRYTPESDPQDGPCSIWMEESVEGHYVTYSDYQKLVAENARMDAFVDECLKVAWEGGALDGGEIQDIGLKHGLLREEEYSSDQHESLVEDPSNFEDGNAVYFRTEMTSTDAAIAEIGAKAIENAINAQSGKPCITDKNGLSYINLGGIQDLAANLRAGRKG